MSTNDRAPRRRRRGYDDPKVMEFWEHLEELRWVIFKSLIAVTITTGVCLTFTGAIYRVLLFPLRAVRDQQQIVLRYDGPLDAFLIKLKMGLLGGVVLAAPAILYFIWTFVAPGLLERERRAIKSAAAAGFGFFLCGVAFGYWLLTLVLPILARFSDPEVRNLWRLKTYMDFAFRLLLGVGVAFEMPVVLTALVRVGLLDVEKLEKGRPYAVVIAMVVAAILTPPDPFTQCMLGLPLIVLYEISVMAAKWQERILARDRKREDENDDEGPEPSGTNRPRSPQAGAPPDRDDPVEPYAAEYYEDPYDDAAATMEDPEVGDTVNHDASNHRQKSESAPPPDDAVPPAEQKQENE